jgi:hypothetical protein
MDTGTVILTLIGVGIIVVGILNLMRMPPQQSSVVVVDETRRYPGRYSGLYPGWRPRWGPYYSHLPARHLVY